MKEMKRIKSGKGALEELPSCVDGAEGEQEIANKFKEVYELLYNSADSETEMMKVKDILHGMIKAEDPEPEIRKITGEIVKEAITRITNMALLRSETGLDPWEVSNSQLKAALLRESRVETPPMDFWRPSYLAKLLKQRMEAYYKADEGECLEVQKLIDSLCIN